MIVDGELDAVPIVCVLKDNYGAFVYANRQVGNWFRVPTGGFIGKTDYHLMPDVDAAAVRVNDKLVLDTGKELLAVEFIHDSEGNTNAYLVSKFLVDGGARKFLGVLGLKMDLPDDDIDAATERAKEKLAKTAPLLRLGLERVAHEIGSKAPAKRSK